MSLSPGASFAGFSIERKLGAGGMGVVYLAIHPRLKRPVALKVLTESFSEDRKTRSAFDREATVAAGLDHPNIVSVYDRSSVDEPEMWLAMRYIEGGDAAGLLRDNPGGLAPDRAVRLLADAADALDYAHARGVLHRDVKPANLLIEKSSRHGERAMLTDFGIARTLDDTVTLSGVTATFAYAAPERFLDVPADHRADIYSLGCTLFQLLTGRPPFPRQDQAGVIAAHLTAPPPAASGVRPGLPEELDTVIATAMAKAPEDRYPTCTALAEAATRALPPPVLVSLEKEPPPERAGAGEESVPTVVRVESVPDAPTPATVAGAGTRAARRRRQRATVAGGALAVGLGVMVGGGLVVWGISGSPSTTSPESPSSVIVSQQVTTPTEPVRVEVTSSSEPTPQVAVAPPAEEIPAEVEVEQTRPPVTYPRQVTPPAQVPTEPAPTAVPRTRVHQFPG